MSMQSRKSIKQEPLKVLSLDDTSSTPQIVDPFSDANATIEKQIRIRDAKLREEQPIDGKEWKISDKSVDQDVWNKLVALRSEKVISEHKKRAKDQELKKAKQRFIDIQNEETVAMNEINKAREEIDTFSVLLIIYFSKQCIIIDKILMY